MTAPRLWLCSGGWRGGCPAELGRGADIGRVALFLLDSGTRYRKGSQLFAELLRSPDHLCRPPRRH